MRHLVIEVQKFRILIAKAGAEAQFICVTSVQEVCLVTLQQSINFTNKLVGRLVLVNTVGLFLRQPGENGLESFNKSMAPVLCETDPLMEKPQKEFDSDLQLRHGFRDSAVALDAVLAKRIPIEKEPGAQILLESLH